MSRAGGGRANEPTPATAAVTRGSSGARPRHRRLPFDAESAVAHLRDADPELGAAMAAMGPFGLELRPARSLFGGLAEAIVHQQLSTRAAATIFGRVLELPGADGADLAPGQVIGATDEQLRAAGLSRAKTLALRDLADRTESGRLPGPAEIRRMSDEQVIERLIEVRGIGRWSAEMFLVFRLGRPDVLPVDDLGVRKGFAAVFGGTGEAAAVLLRGERWRPYRTVATWYLWRAVGGGL